MSFGGKKLGDGQEKGKKKATDGRHDGKNPDVFNGPPEESKLSSKVRPTKGKVISIRPNQLRFVCIKIDLISIFNNATS